MSYKMLVAMNLGQEHNCRALEGSGIAGYVGGWCAVQANFRVMCECAAVVLVLRVSLSSRLSSTAVDL